MVLRMVRQKISLLINNGLVVTLDPEMRVIDNGYLAIDEDRIVDIGKGDGKDRYVAEKVIDAGKGIILPGLLNAHTHLYGILLRASPWFSKIEPPTDFHQNLQRIWWVLDVLLRHEDAYASALIGSIELVKSGVTMFLDTYSGPNSIAGVLDYIEKGIREVGLKALISFEATQRRSLREGFEGLAENERFIRKNNRDKSNPVRGLFCLHASFTVKDELFKKARELASKYGALLTIHAEEGMIDVMHNIERYGLRPIERMEKLGFLGNDVILAHVVHVTREELSIIAKSDTHVAHNAMSNMLNAVGVAPVPEMIELGINVGIGNDGYVFDQFENMRTTYLLHKVSKRDPRVLAPIDVIMMSTINVARMFHMEKQLGSLERGKKADIVIIKPNELPTPLTTDTVYGHIINSISSKDVDTVVVNGEIVLENRKLTKLDEAKAREYIHRVVERLWDRLESSGKYQLDVLEL